MEIKMAKLKIVKFGDPLLRKVSRPVEEITPRILTLLDDMKETMRAAEGCGLAAVQVGMNFLKERGFSLCRKRFSPFTIYPASDAVP